MSRRMVALDAIDRHISTEDIDPGSYVRSKWSDEGPYSALLWQEVREIEIESGMSPRQATIFEWHLMGLTASDIARVLKINESAVRKILASAHRRARRCANIGLTTVLTEQCGGWQAVRDVLG